MPAFGEKLKEEEISALVAHLRSLGGSKKKQRVAAVAVGGLLHVASIPQEE
jgi:mono/diheme cytochrome c family protein